MRLKKSVEITASTWALNAKLQLKGKCVFLVCEKGGIKLEVGKQFCLTREIHPDHNSKTMSSLEVHLCIWKLERVQSGTTQIIQQLENWTYGRRSKVISTSRCLKRDLGGDLVITSVEWRGSQREQAISAPRSHFGSICCHVSTAEPSGFPGKTVLPAPPGKALHLIKTDSDTCYQFYLGSM